MKAYVATGEYAQLVCAFDKNPAKALKKAAKKIDELQNDNEYLMLTGVNINYDDEGFYYVTATVSTAVL
jgi:hypothetical protein